MWLDIIGYEGFYQVSDFGCVRSVDRVVNGRQYKGRNLKLLESYGYYSVQLRKINKKGCFYIHRLVASAFLSNPENKPQVNHLDKNKKNNNAYNLEWCTISENSLHGGNKNSFHTRKFTDDDILKIRDMYESGKTVYFISKYLNENTGTISNIVNYKTYKNVS